MRQHITFIAAASLVLGCTNKRLSMAPSPEEGHDPRWTRIDSLANKAGLFATALAETDTLLREARMTGDEQQEFRAMMYRARFQAMTGTDRKDVIAELEQRASTAGFPLKPLLQSVVAEQYWNYYQQDRWRILDRTNVASSDTEGIDTWDQRRFMTKVVALYRSSLDRPDSLKATPIGSIAELLGGDERTRALRPTLFDLLAHRALEVFMNSETRLAEPAWRFRIEGTGAFALFEEFMAKAYQHRDSDAWEFQALRLYQQLERAHLSDTGPDALVDVTLSRLAFVRERSTHQRKDSLYLEALDRLASRLSKDTCLGEVLLAQARWHAEMGGRYQRLSDVNGSAAPWKWERRNALARCEDIIKRFPGTFAARNAAGLRAQLHERELEVRMEEGVMPGQPFKAAVSWRNVRKVWLRLVTDDSATEEYLLQGGYSDGERSVARKALREWTVALPDDGDLAQHMTEVPVEGLPFGQYALIACDSSTFRPQVDHISFARFWVTRLAMTERWQHGSLDLLVVDRATGAPKAGAHIVQWIRDPHTSKGFVRSPDQLTTGPDGFMRKAFKGAQGNLGWELIDGDDRFVSGQTWIPGDYDGAEVENIRTFILTDRAIYRPGQPVMFKGIVTRRSGKNNEVVPNHRTRVELFDVNGQKVDSLSVTTDAYGSFHGTFNAPSGTLTGSMTLQEEHGARSVQVEEYKRPTFEVVFDPIKGQPRLGEQVSVTGQAKSYAGAPLDDAEVQWTVKRGARMPWWCDLLWRGWLPWGEETEIANGVARCDGEGRFTVTFTAQADDRFPRESDPSFNYTVDASATDINGETQSSTTSLTLGYRSITIDIGLGESIDRNTVDSLSLSVRNLNGQALDVPLDVRVHRLQAPPIPLRDRLWERPDRFVMSREEHASRFPQEVYNNENDPLAWSRGAQVFEEQGWVANGRNMAFRQARSWEVGTYLLEAVAKDEGGREVRVTKAFTVYDANIQNTGFAAEAFHVEPVKVRCEPGEKASLLISSPLREAHVLMEVERNEHIAVSRWFNLSAGQQRIDLPVLEDDRGGFAVHLFCAERGRDHSSTQWIDVPWTTKELKVEWMSFRDKLKPGEEEEWRLKITGSKGEQVAAQLLSAMYDASLDHFVPHGWDMDIWPTHYAQLGWQRQEPFGMSGGQVIWAQGTSPGDTVRTYPVLNTFGLEMIGGRFRGAYAYGWAGDARAATDGEVMLESANANATTVAFAPAQVGTEAWKGDGTAGKDKDGIAPVRPEQEPGGQAGQPLRSDFRETAFFFPDLLTDRDGSIVLRFKAPDALTRWKVLGLAHTKDLEMVSFMKEAVTQKPMMVVPNLPRFLREGDRITLTSKINLIEGKRAEGIASLELYDPFTNASLNKAFGSLANTRPFIAAPGASAVVEWTITVPEGVSACGLRITAKSAGGPRSDNGFSDGEERVLPVLTDRMLVTESLPLWISKAGTRTFSLEKLKSSSSPTLKHQSLKLEYTPNPAWYAVQALPYLMEFPHECAEQTFSRYYANTLASHIVEERPAIRKVLDHWKATSPENFLSNLEKNQDLKGALLAETPWVLNARNERESEQRIALLFDLQRMSKEQKAALAKLRDMQLADGAWPWWSGMSESRYITEHIVAGMGHLEMLNATGRGDGATQQMVERAVAWIDQEVARDYQELLKHTKKEDLEKFVPGGPEIHFLYARSFFTRWPIAGGTETAVEFYRQRLRSTWLRNGLQEQAMAALALDRFGDKETARAIMRSLSERATRSEELGMYWKDFTAGFDWWSFPTETHALMVEAFHEVAHDEASVNALRTYLLKLKQTTDWRSTKATADACYALLLTGNDWLKSDAAPVIKVGDAIVGSNDDALAGIGTIERTWSAAEIRPDMGNVTITSKVDKPSWGALHWQYFERMDRIAPHESPFRITKQVLLAEQKDGLTHLVPLGDARALKAGDKLTVRIELRTDRYVDYVHMKDLRASGLEPTETLSGYRYQGGLGYYQSIRDASTNFFFDRIAPGTHVFEYTLRVTHAGEFSNGITTAQCMYAPEFSSHSEGTRIHIPQE